MELTLENVIDVINDEYKGYYEFNENTSIADVGIHGLDAYNLLLLLEKEFVVTFEKFEFNKYFLPEHVVVTRAGSEKTQVIEDKITVLELYQFMLEHRGVRQEPEGVKIRSVTEEIRIPLSKKKMALPLIGSFAFVVFGFWFFIIPSVAENFSVGRPSLFFILGLVTVLFFGLVAFIVIVKMLKNKPGLIINDEGIIDNLSVFGARVILWEDIQYIDRFVTKYEKSLMVFLKNPQGYMDRQKKLNKWQTINRNIFSLKSPIYLNCSMLEMDIYSLYALLETIFVNKES